jgi:hypothetical protein
MIEIVICWDGKRGELWVIKMSVKVIEHTMEDLSSNVFALAHE